jgi:predicted transcriptional regulator
MTKTKVREVVIKESRGSFNLFGIKESIDEKYDFDGLSSLKQLLSKEKAKILDVIKYQKPGSIYALAKLLNRPFKAVFDDIKLLERFGFIELIAEKTKNRVRHKPEIIVDHMIIHIRI